MAMIEFEDHSEENQEALLAYLNAQECDTSRPSKLILLGLIDRLARSLRLAWAAVSPRSGR